MGPGVRLQGRALPSLSLFVDTCIWSLALRRSESPKSIPEVERLRQGLTFEEPIYTTGLVLQELLQGFRGPKAGPSILERFAHLPVLVPHRDDHFAAAELRNHCRRQGVQLHTIDALLASLCIRNELRMLTTDRDFYHAAQHTPVRIWGR